MDKTKIKKSAIAGISMAVGVTLVVGLLAVWNPLNKWQLKLTNRLYDRNEASTDIVIVGVDENSLSEESGFGRWGQWDRTVYIPVIENLEKAGAKVIAFDIFFSEASQGLGMESWQEIIQKNPTPLAYLTQTAPYFTTPHPSDTALAETFKKYSNIVLAKKINQITDGNTYVVNPIPPFEKNASTAWVNVVPDEDEVIRRIPASFINPETGSPEPSMAFKVSEISGKKNLDTSELLINYAAPPFSFPTMSLVDVHNGHLSENVNGKIVLIGPIERKLQDVVSTPTSSVTLMPGVEVHANAIQTIVEGNFLHEQSIGSQLVMMGLLVTLLTALVLILGILPGLASALLLIVLVHVLAKPVFDQGLILNLVYPTIALFVTYLTATLYKYLGEVREKSKLKGAFGKYVNKDLVTKILEDPDALKLGGATRTVTVFFSDIANFTHFSELSTPEAVVEQLNQYFDVMVGIILKNGGTVNKFEGDAIMAFWGAPVDQPDHAVRAARTALECRAALSELHTRWQQESKPLLDFRIGLSSGPAIAGNMGSSERLEYTVMGDIVNLGARLESANKQYGSHIMLAGDTQALLGDTFLLRRLDRLRVKGKDQPVDVYELLGFADQSTESQKSGVNTFHQAIEYYRNGAFEEASTRFNQVLAVWPQDGPTQTYLQRCTTLRSAPTPPVNWDGTWTLSEK